MRKEYNFANNLRYERLYGCKFTCEHCGKVTRDLQVHHVMGAYLSSRNLILTPQMVKTIENAMCLCKDCHRSADDDQKSWTGHDIGILAWALWDIDPKLVEINQKNTYQNKPRVKERVRRRRRRR